MTMSVVDDKEIKKAILDIFSISSRRLGLDTILFFDYILALIFLKYISDLLKDIKQDKIIVHNSKLKKLLSNAPENVSFYSIYDDVSYEGIGERINAALRFYDETVFYTLYKCDELIFNNIDFSSDRLGLRRDRDVFLKELMHVMSSTGLQFDEYSNGKERIKLVCSVLFEKVASEAGPRGGDFYTPHGVCELLSELVLPVAEDSIYDPACGTGSLLLSAIQKMPDKGKCQNYKVYGQDIMKSSWRITYINMFLHGVYSCQIKSGDVFLNPQFQDSSGELQKFDVVLSNPPFSMSNWGYEEVLNDRFGRFSLGMPPQSKADYAFILHMISSLKDDTGRMAVVVPHGVLFRGANEALIRMNLINGNLLDAVIGLPNRLFLSTSIPTAILVFKKNKMNTNILFIDSTMFFDKTKGRNYITDEHIKKIFNVFHERQYVENISYVACLDEIRDNDYNLNVTRYVKSVDEPQDIDIYSLIDEQEKLKAELYTLEKEMKYHIDY